MFGKQEQDESGAAIEDRGGKVKVLGVNGTAVALLVGRKVRVVSASGPGAPVAVSEHGLPAFGEVLSGSPVGPTVVMASGDLLAWSKGRFRLVANVREAEVNR